MEDNNKVIFFPGDLVTIKQDLPNKPIMVVKQKAIYFNIKESRSGLKGILCFWFSLDGNLQEAVFNTKDLLKL